MKHTYFRTCRRCGANLDPGEQCSCQGQKSISRMEPIRVPPVRERKIRTGRLIQR